MDERTFDGLAQRLATSVSRRRTAQLLAGGLTAGLLGRPVIGSAKRCTKRTQSCTTKAQCCGKKARCATSHGGGSDTCCGARGARCSSDLTCCIKYLCEGGRCVPPPPMEP